MDRFDVNALRSNAATFAKDARERAEELWRKASFMEDLEERKMDRKMKKTILTVLAIIGIVASVAAIAYAVYRFVAPKYLGDCGDEDFFDDEDEDIVEE